MSVLERVWRVAAHDSAGLKELTAALRITPLLAQVMRARGIDSPAAGALYLAKKLTDLHEPERLPGVSAAAEQIVAAVRDRRRITIYGDYDVDGVTATSLLWHCLQLAGAEVDYYIPSRLEEGYGLNCDALTQLHQEDPARLVVTVDCGITSVAEAVHARQLGLDLIISDHHHFAETLPAALAVVHPRLPGEYPFGELCGVGVAFKLAWAICARLGDGKRASPRMREFLLQAVGLTAIGTIADVVPLVDENRVLVHFGLGSLKERATPGLKALLELAKLDEQPTLQAEDIAFAIAPRINAAGRLGQARLAVELLTTENVERAHQLARYLDELNKNRQTVERKMLKQAKELVEEHPTWQDAPALVLTHPDWHAGVIGIVAARVAEHFRKPTILIAGDDRLGLLQGSGRTAAGVDLHAALVSCRDVVRGFGGHAAAAGVKLEPTQIDAFRERFAEAVARVQPTTNPGAELLIDAEVRLTDVTRNAVLELERIGPFGASNRRPVFVATDVELVGAPRKMGEGERHLSLMVRQFGTSLRGVAFGKGDWADELTQGSGPLAVCFQPVINRFRGEEKVEFQLLDWHRG